MRQLPLVLDTVRPPGSTLARKVWDTLREQAAAAIERDRSMTRPIGDTLLRHGCLADALSHRIGRKLADCEIDCATLEEIISEVLELDPAIVDAAAADLLAVCERDPACPDLITPFLYFKGYQALQTHRVSHALWGQSRMHMARHLQSRSSEVFAVDIHPAARMGRAILLDHGTGLVIGETAEVDDDVSILQEVTLGGTGKESGDRHPKIRRGVLIGAGAKILGNIEVGEGAKVGAGSIVLEAVEPYTTVVGVPAKPVGPRNTCLPALTMDQTFVPQNYAI